MVHEEKTAFIRHGSQQYRRYTSSSRNSSNSDEDLIYTGNEEEICMKTKIGFGCGHIYNDIAGNAGFGYGLLYYTTVVGLSNVHVGYIFLIGNIVDAVAVAATGILIDMDFNCKIYSRYGQFKSSHLLGTICLLVGFSLMFLPPLGIETEETVIAYYTVIFSVLAIGYAIVAISHNCIILKLANSKSNQILLASLKTSGTAIACIIIYVTAYFCLGGDEDKLGSNAFISFVLITSIAGAMTSVLFHLLVSETPQNQIGEVSDRTLLSEFEVQGTPNVNRDFVSNMTKTEWLKNVRFHVVIMLYAISRTIYTVCLAYLVFYVQYTLMLKRSYIASVPLVMVLIGLILSKPIKQFIDSNGLEKCMMLFCLMGGLTCTWIWFGCRNDQSKRYEIFGIAVCLGICSYSMMVVSLSLVVALIGKNLGM